MKGSLQYQFLTDENPYFLFYKIQNNQALYCQTIYNINKQVYMSFNPLTTISVQGRQTLLDSNKLSTSSYSISKVQTKFLEHFQTINKSENSILQTHNDDFFSKYQNSGQNTFISKMAQYSTMKNSTIDKIMRMNDEDEMIFVKKQYKYVERPPLINFKKNVKQNVSAINLFFDLNSNETVDESQHQNLLQNQILQISVFSTIMMNMQKQKSKIQTSIYATPDTTTMNVMNNTHLDYNYKQAQMNTEIQRSQSGNMAVGGSFQPPQKLKKADLILVQIMRQKKRKGLVSDYYKIMELKLLELLDYIVQDEHEFIGLNSVDKMKEVLKKLDSFKGKTKDGQSKINLLRIFFEEFKNLKNQMQTANVNSSISPTILQKKPLESVSNKLRQQPKKTQKQKQAKQYSIKNPSTLKNWPKKQGNSQTMSMGAGQRKQKRIQAPKISNKSSVNGKDKNQIEDQWIGQLN